MKLRTSCLVVILLACLLFGMTRVSVADSLAIEKLLEIFEKKGVITPAEVEIVRETMAEDQERLLRKEKEVTDAEAVEQDTTGFRDTAPQDRKTETGLSLEASYRDGFCLSTREPGLFSLRLGGLLQVDYRYFDYGSEDPDKNKSDLRRVRLRIGGQALRLFDYKFEYDFQGAGSRRLLDAYVDANLFPFASFRIGQFKEPFSLEQCTLDSVGWFAERSMGFYLTPQRDVGLMAHASLWGDRIDYGLGIFNGDGLDDTTGGDVDDPQFTGRVAFSPFKYRGTSLLDNLQVGGVLFIR